MLRRIDSVPKFIFCATIVIILMVIAFNSGVKKGSALTSGEIAEGDDSTRAILLQRKCDEFARELGHMTLENAELKRFNTLLKGDLTMYSNLYMGETKRMMKEIDQLKNEIKSLTGHSDSKETSENPFESPPMGVITIPNPLAPPTISKSPFEPEAQKESVPIDGTIDEK